MRVKPRRLLVALSAELLPESLAVRVINAECDRLDAAWRRGTLNVSVKSLLPDIDKPGSIIREPVVRIGRDSRAQLAALEAYRQSAQRVANLTGLLNASNY